MTMTSKEMPNYVTPLVFILFSWMLIANGYFLYTAFGTKTGSVDDDPYGKSLVYQKTIDGLEAGKSYKLNLLSNRAAVALEIHDRKGEPLTNLKGIKYKAIFPADSSYDREGSFDFVSEREIYNIDQPLPRAGLWLMKFSAAAGEQELLFERQLMIE